ncbi:hypothetical protein [Stenotrophomonas sp.]|uniref:hypothetical protein n=1 Tax=Stenotrophomonas sp. TaxID=69392 RepID=UPI00289E3708|nr:hypothetical protein [Stenotrophomonas sp.]
MHDLRGIAAGGGHFVECQCQATRRHVEPHAALIEWRRNNRPGRSAPKALPAITAPVDNVIQLRLPMPATGRAAGT